jgi:HCOMODA/2-hydroxy-3-carboxy-muconic semialdehyde decarboxylase
MRGHGSTTVGNSIKQVVFRAIYAEANAKLVTEALRLGNGRITYLNEKEAANAAVSNDRSVERPWANWKASALERR